MKGDAFAFFDLAVFLRAGDGNVEAAAECFLLLLLAVVLLPGFSSYWLWASRKGSEWEWQQDGGGGVEFKAHPPHASIPLNMPLGPRLSLCVVSGGWWLRPQLYTPVILDVGNLLSSCGGGAGSCRSVPTAPLQLHCYGTPRGFRPYLGVALRSEGV